jgi:hypothetical protein
MFNQQELQILIGGVEEPVDVDNLMRSCIYGGVYDESHPTIQRFWKVRGRVPPQRPVTNPLCRLYGRWTRKSGNLFCVLSPVVVGPLFCEYQSHSTRVITTEMLETSEGFKNSILVSQFEMQG